MGYSFAEFPIITRAEVGDGFRYFQMRNYEANNKRMLFETLNQLIGEPFEITSRNIHRWKIRDGYTFSVFHWREDRFGYTAKNQKGLFCSGGEGLDQERIIEAARWATGNEVTLHSPKENL